MSSRPVIVIPADFPAMVSRSPHLELLNETADLFNADVWVGRQAADLGLVDGVAKLFPHVTQVRPLRDVSFL